MSTAPDNQPPVVDSPASAQSPGSDPAPPDLSFYRLRWKCRMCKSEFDEGKIEHRHASFAIDDLLRVGYTQRTNPHQQNVRWHTCRVAHGVKERLGICDLQGFVHQPWPLKQAETEDQNNPLLPQSGRD